MLIQPFVENAILHGLRHKKDEIGELFLNLKVTDNQLIIFVIDNGIGREASQKINSLKNILKQSVGVKLSEERIAKLNEIYAPQSYLKITDIDENNDKGTIVEIGLPLITHQDLSR
jgi:sensor histidine kinase YesM